MIDAKSAKVVATIALGGSPEFGVEDGDAGRVYCNLEDKNEVVAIDTTKHEVAARWPLARAKNQPASRWTRRIIGCSQRAITRCW